MTCEVCAYWEWRLKDLRLTRKKDAIAYGKALLRGNTVPMSRANEDVASALKARVQHVETHG